MHAPRQEAHEAASRELRELTDERYRDVRRPKVVRFYRNGDRHFRARSLHITPHRYASWSELLTDLSRAVPMPHGVRRVYSPLGGSLVTGGVEALRDGASYVCASFEPFRPLCYGGASDATSTTIAAQQQQHSGPPSPRKGPPLAGQRCPLEERYSDSSCLAIENGTSDTRRATNGMRAPSPLPPSSRDTSNVSPSYSPPERARKGHSEGLLIRRADRSQRRSFHGQSENQAAVVAAAAAAAAAARPKVVTVVRVGGRPPHRRITLLLNRRSVQSFEELAVDISEVLGIQRVRRLFTLRGREARSISDFFRGDDVFLATPGKEPPSSEDVQSILEELFPENPYAQRLVVRDSPKSQTLVKKSPERPLRPRRRSHDTGRLQPDGEFDDDVRTEVSSPRGAVAQRDYVERQKAKARQEERDKAHRWERERWEREQKEVEQKRLERLKEATRQESPEGLHAVEDEKKPEKLWDLDEEVKKMEKRRDQKRRKKEEEEREQERSLLERERRWQESEEKKRERRYSEKDQGRRTLNEADVDRHRRIVMDDRERLQQEEEARRRKEEELKITQDERKLEGDRRRLAEKENGAEEYINGDFDKRAQRQQRQEESSANDRDRARPKHKSKDSERRRKQKKPLANQRPVVTLRDIESRYEIGRTIGDGNFAVVKECRRRVGSGEGRSTTPGEWDLAMKIVDKSKLAGREEMLENEVTLTARLGHHPNVVRLLESLETPSHAYLVLERVSGGDLFDAITESVRFTERHAAAMVADLCRALQYLHANLVVHRDVKPENLLMQRKLDGSTMLKLGDFGLAMEVRGPIYTVCGTPTYVAPEILAETGYGLEVDMWAAGVITYILLCGFPPFRSLERDQEELFDTIQLGEFSFLSPYWDHISEAAKDLVSRMLVVDTKRRFTARQALHHPWVTGGGAGDAPDLHREVTMNIQRHFADRRRPHQQQQFQRMHPHHQQQQQHRTRPTSVSSDV